MKKLVLRAVEELAEVLQVASGRARTKILLTLNPSLARNQHQYSLNLASGYKT
jgi:hypothetical protein